MKRATVSINKRDQFEIQVIEGSFEGGSVLATSCWHRSKADQAFADLQRLCLTHGADHDLDGTCPEFLDALEYTEAA